MKIQEMDHKYPGELDHIRDRFKTPEPNYNESPDDASILTPFLTKHISESVLPTDNYHKYCYRHNPEISRNDQVDNSKMMKIQNDMEKLSSNDQQAITHVWSIFSAAPNSQRKLILQGILSQCCFPTLSFISSELSSLIKIDFISALPVEISLKILCYLDCASLCNAAQVSKNWKRLADDDRVWHHMCEQHIDRKCPKCGWGLPLMHMKRAREEYENATTNEGGQNISSSRRNSQDNNNHHHIDHNNNSNNPQGDDHANNSDSNNPTTTSSHATTERDATGDNNAVVDNRNQHQGSEPVESMSNESHDSDEERQIKKRKLSRRPWKSVYSERYKLEKNWRKGIYNVQEFIGHTDGITCLQFNNKYLITGSYDTTIKIWDLKTQACIRTLTGHTKGIRSLIFDNQKLISCGLDLTIKVWNYHNGQCISTYRGHEDAVVSVDFHDKTIVSGSADNTIKVWHVDSRTCYTLRGHNDWVNCVKIHPASNTCFSASDDTTIKMWDLKTHKCIKTFGGVENNGHVGQVQCIIPFNYKDKLYDDFGNDSESDEEYVNRDKVDTTGPSHLISSSLDNTIKVWDIKTGKCIRTQFGHIEGVWSISADNFRIVSGAHDRLIKVWDLQNGKCLHTFGNNASVSCVGLSDSKFAAGLENGIVKVYCFE